MKKLLLIGLIVSASCRLIAQSSIILPNGNVIPSFTQANRPANPTIGQLIYQTDGTNGLYIWNGTAWSAVASGSGGGSGTVTNVTGNSPISVTNGSTTPQISLSQANSTTNGFLSSTDWTTFNNKQNALPQANGTTNGFLSSTDWTNFNNKFSLPFLNSGSILFSNGSTILQNNAKLYWDIQNAYLGVGTFSPNRTLTVSSTNDGTGTNDWIAGNFGGTSGNRVVIGILNGEATIGSHSNQLTGWTNLNINPAGTIKMPSIAGGSSQMVVVGTDGLLSSQAIPTSSAGTVTTVSATSPLSVTNASSTPQISISQANGSTNGFLSSTDWTTFNNKFTLPSLTDGSILFSNGTTITQNNSSLKWSNSIKRFDVRGLNDGTVGAGFTNWISTSIGGSGGNRIVMGVQNGEATIGAHNENLSGWAKLVLNPAGATAVGSLTGVGTRMVVANATGELSSQALPTGADNLGNHTATQTINVNDNWISNNGTFAGMKMENSGKVIITNGNPTADPTFVVGTSTTTVIDPENNTTITEYSLDGSSPPRQLVVNGSIRQSYYTIPVSVPAQTTITIIWNHNLGYGPVVMMSTDGNGTGANSDMERCTYTTYNNNVNQTVFKIYKHGNGPANGNFRWIIVN